MIGRQDKSGYITFQLQFRMTIHEQSMMARKINAPDHVPNPCLFMLMTAIHVYEPS